MHFYKLDDNDINLICNENGMCVGYLTYIYAIVYVIHSDISML